LSSGKAYDESSDDSLPSSSAFAQSTRGSRHTTASIPLPHQNFNDFLQMERLRLAEKRRRRAGSVTVSTKGAELRGDSSSGAKEGDMKRDSTSGVAYGIPPVSDKHITDTAAVAQDSSAALSAELNGGMSIDTPVHLGIDLASSQRGGGLNVHSHGSGATSSSLSPSHVEVREQALLTVATINHSAHHRVISLVHRALQADLKDNRKINQRLHHEYSPGDGHHPWRCQLVDTATGLKFEGLATTRRRAKAEAYTLLWNSWQRAAAHGHTIESTPNLSTMLKAMQPDASFFFACRMAPQPYSTQNEDETAPS